MGVRNVCATIGEIVGETRPAGEDLSGNRGLVMLPRLQSRKQPCWIGLDEKWPYREEKDKHIIVLHVTQSLQEAF